MNTYRAGIDIGSTTVKLVVLNERNEILFGDYRRHHAHTQQTLNSLLKSVRQKLGECALRVKITGSGSINLGKALGIGFVQEVVAVATALKETAPQTDVAIELGGEDAKIIYFTGGLEERMNGVCAGGTGSFIDQMAALLQTDASINPGNSGGGLFDQYGHLIGIVVAKSSGSDIEGLGFAIPINTAAKIAKALIEDGAVESSNKASIGIQVVEITDAQMAMQYDVQYTGVYVQDVTSKKAKKAGLKSGDMIYYFEDSKIETFDDLSKAIAKHQPGDKVTITVIRDNQTIDINVELIETES